ncbi:MAG: hypothetical protein MUD12_16325 [Spirochaetes bacterium]|nr:hypothetical protein [Spirochaetota bacterium]
MNKKTGIFMIIPVCLFLAAVFSISRTGLGASDKISIAVQPLGPVDADALDAVKNGILSAYRVRVEVRTPLPLPRPAYYDKAKRYRAEKLLDFLESLDGCDKIIGLTSADISTTKGSIPDWGIFGLGTMGGRACVVSTFRLGRGNVPRGHFLARLVKVANHELGHTFGLDHCPVKGCLMEDAKGTIRTVDGESGAPCAGCRKKIKGIIIEGPR